MKTFKRILKETMAMPPDMPQQSAHIIQAPRTSTSRIDFKRGIYIPRVRTSSPVTQTDHPHMFTTPDSPAFDSEESAQRYVNDRMRNAVKVDPSHEHSMGVFHNVNTNSSDPWYASNQVDGGKTEVGSYADGNMGATKKYNDLPATPDELTDHTHTHPFTKGNPVQTAASRVFSKADTDVPINIMKGQAAHKHGEYDSYAYKTPVKMHLLYPTSDTDASKWGNAQYVAGEDKLTNISYRTDMYGGGRDTVKNLSLGHKEEDEEPTVKAYPAPEQLAHADDEKKPDRRFAGGPNPMHESIVMAFLNNRH